MIPLGLILLAMGLILKSRSSGQSAAFCRTLISSSPSWARQAARRTADGIGDSQNRR